MAPPRVGAPSPVGAGAPLARVASRLVTRAVCAISRHRVHRDHLAAAGPCLAAAACRQPRRGADRPGTRRGALARPARRGGRAGPHRGRHLDGDHRARLVAAVLNRPGSLGPAPGKRSRGDLPLLALTHETAAGAAGAMAALDGAAYRTFNLVLADREASGSSAARAGGRSAAVAPGLHWSPRTTRRYGQSAGARASAAVQRRAAPRPAAGDWSVLGRVARRPAGPRGAALNVPAEGGFSTVCASLAAVSAQGAPGLAVRRRAAGSGGLCAGIPALRLGRGG